MEGSLQSERVITEKCLNEGKVLNLRGVDLDNLQNLACVVKSLDEIGLSKSAKEVIDLEHCKLTHRNIESLYTALSKNIANSFQLFMSWNKLGDKGMIPLRTLFTSGIKLSRLHLDGNDLGNMGVQSLLRAMEVCRPRITHLSLDYNNIGGEGMLCLAAKFHTALGSITWLSIGNNDMSGGKVAEVFGKSVISSRTLKHLNLSSNRLGVLGSGDIANHLITKNIFLRSIDLTNNNMGNEGAYALSAALQKNNVLSCLRIGSNNIGPQGCSSFVDGLSTNDSLKELDLSRTHSNQLALGIEGARQIAQMLEVNHGLTYLNLYWCKIESPGALILASALEENKTIRKINLGGNYIGPSALKKIMSSLSPMYVVSEEDFGASSWDSKVPCAPLFLNRKVVLASRRPQSAATAPKNSSSTTSVRRARDTINVKSRISILVRHQDMIKKIGAKGRSKLSVKELFAITPCTMTESPAILPEIRHSLLEIDTIVGKNKAIAKASPAKLLKVKEAWGGDSLPSSAANRKPQSRTAMIFHI